MSRQKLIKQLKKKNIQLNQSDLETIIDIFCDGISNALLKGDNVEIRNAKKIIVKTNKKIKFNLLYDTNRSLQKKIKLEQLRRETN